MRQEVFNFSRFFTLVKLIYADKTEQEAYRKQLVREYTGGRTDSLREIRKIEYDRLIRDLEDRTGEDKERKAREWIQAETKRWRSYVLSTMQKALHLDTSNWKIVDAVCMSNRIAGKPFRYLDIVELQAVNTKLRAIANKGGLKPIERQHSVTGKMYYSILFNHSDSIN